MRTRLLVVALVVTVALTGAAVVIHGAAGPSRGPLTWSDEFDGPAGTPPDPSRWRYDLGGDGWAPDARGAAELLVSFVPVA